MFKSRKQKQKYVIILGSTFSLLYVVWYISRMNIPSRRIMNHVEYTRKGVNPYMDIYKYILHNALSMISMVWQLRIHFVM